MSLRGCWRAAGTLAATFALTGLWGDRIVWAEDKPATQQNQPAAKKVEPAFMRLLRDDKDEPLALQTSIVRYVRPGVDEQEFHVDLIGAVHVGETAYYKRLNREFKKYEALLYELVAPQGTRVPKGGGKPDHPLGMLQSGMKDALEFDYQLDRVDYHQKNFVHADMSPEQFSNKMQERGESFASMFLKAMGYALAEQSKKPARGNDFKLLGALFDPNQSLALKRAMAEQFEDLDGSIGALEGADGSTIISERNKVALEVLRKQIDGGKKKLAIFYGAGHLSDMEERLLKDFGVERKNIEWITAWDLRDKKAKQ